MRFSLRALGARHSRRSYQVKTQIGGKTRRCAIWKGLRRKRSQKNGPANGPDRTGGDGGIRTHDTAFWPYAPLAGECLRPLGHVSGKRAFYRCRPLASIAARARNAISPLRSNRHPVEGMQWPTFDCSGSREHTQGLVQHDGAEDAARAAGADGRAHAVRHRPAAALQECDRLGIAASVPLGHESQADGVHDRLDVGHRRRSRTVADPRGAAFHACRSRKRSGSHHHVVTKRFKTAVSSTKRRCASHSTPWRASRTSFGSDPRCRPDTARGIAGRASVVT